MPESSIDVVLRKLAEWYVDSCSRTWPVEEVRSILVHYDSLGLALPHMTALGRCMSDGCVVESTWFCGGSQYWGLVIYKFWSFVVVVWV